MTEPQPKLPVREDVAYFLPMVTFLVLTFVGGQWPATYAVTYVAKTVIVAGMLIAFRRAYTPIKWDYWWLGVIVGVIGIFQWIGMQLWLQEHFTRFQPDTSNLVDPTTMFASPALSYAFIGFRWIAGAVILVPVMEELFWRDYLWRQIIAPANFKLAAVGEWSWMAFIGVALAFATVHGNWWPTAIVWGLMIGTLLAVTRSLGACIIAHAVTNLLLGSYVLITRDWSFW